MYTKDLEIRMSNYYLCPAYIVTDGPHVLAGLVRRVFLQPLPTFRKMSNKSLSQVFDEIEKAQLMNQWINPIRDQVKGCFDVWTVSGAPYATHIFVGSKITEGTTIRIGQIEVGAIDVSRVPSEDEKIKLAVFGHECEHYRAGHRMSLPILRTDLETISQVLIH